MPFEMGPVLRFETRRYAGRTGWYASRVILCVALLAIHGMYHWVFERNVRLGRGPDTERRLVAELLTSFLVVAHLIIAFLIAPIAAADAFSRERARTMLPTLLMTELSSRRIVWETFAARLIPGIWVWLGLIPITAFLVPWWGVDPTFIAIMEGVTFGSILLGVATTAAFSLWSGRTFHTLVGAYGLLGAWLLCWRGLFGSAPAPSWIARDNPYVLLVNRWNGAGPPTLADAGFFLGGAALLTIAVLTLMAAKFRRVVLASPRSMPRPRTRSGALRAALVNWPAWLPGPSLDGNPVLWREWWRARASVGGRAFWILYTLAASTATVLGVHAFWGGQVARPDLVGVAGFEAGIGLFAVAVRAAFAWSEEKAAGLEGLDLLLSTPMSASTMVMGKWWGAYRGVLLVAILPALAAAILAAGAPASPPGTLPATSLSPLRLIDRAAVMAVVTGQVLVYGAAFVSLGVLLATRLARPTRAVLAMVVAYVVVALVVPTVSEVLFLHSNRLLAEGLGVLSPIGGPIVTLASMFSQFYLTTRQVLPLDLAWLGLAGILAWALLRWTIYRFDRWMGRMPSPPE